MKFCIAPEIAVEMAPARVRCSGSHSPSRHRTGRRKESAASVSQTRDADWYSAVVTRGFTTPMVSLGGRRFAESKLLDRAFAHPVFHPDGELPGSLAIRYARAWLSTQPPRRSGTIS